MQQNKANHNIRCSAKGTTLTHNGKYVRETIIFLFSSQSTLNNCVCTRFSKLLYYVYDQYFFLPSTSCTNSCLLSQRNHLQIPGVIKPTAFLFVCFRVEIHFISTSTSKNKTRQMRLEISLFALK